MCWCLRLQSCWWRQSESQQGRKHQQQQFEPVCQQPQSSFGCAAAWAGQPARRSSYTLTLAFFHIQITGRFFNPHLLLQALASPSVPLGLDTPQVLDSPLLPPLASPTRARSPDVISSASTALSQDMPEIASQTLQHQRGLVSSLEALALPALHTDTMASAASALHLLTSPHSANNDRCVRY